VTGSGKAILPNQSSVVIRKSGEADRSSEGHSIPKLCGVRGIRPACFARLDGRRVHWPQSTWQCDALRGA
jgi:hypothetical protein